MKSKILFLLLVVFFIAGCTKDERVSLEKECLKNLYILAGDLIKIQDLDENSESYGALYCESCSDYHTRASEAVLPFAVAYKESGDAKYLTSAISTGDWLINQQQPDGSWHETPSQWTGTSTDQLLMLSAAYPILENELTSNQTKKWTGSIKKAANWLVENMNHEFASINYCATTTATLMMAFQVIPDSAYVKKAKDLAMLVTSKFDEDYFLTGEGNRIRGTKYGVDLGYSMDMSLWGLGLYSKLAKDNFVDEYVRQSLKRYVYFIYPDGSTDGSWGVRANKWTTYGSVTADGCQILFSLYSKENPAYRKAALENLNYLMKMKAGGLIGYGPNYQNMFDEPPCNYPTFCRAKNLALAVLFGDQSEGEVSDIPTQNIGWAKYFNTMDLALVRTENFMLTVTGYRYKDIRRGADFKYMHRPSGGSITNLWVQDYGYLQASSQTEYHRWEMHFPDAINSLTLTPRIEFTDTNAYYTNLYEFDAHMELSQIDNIYEVKSIGELKDRNRWEGGVSYVLTHRIGNDFLEKHIKLRYHGQKPNMNIIEPFIENPNTKFKKVNDYSVDILGGNREFNFELLNKEYEIEIGTNEERYNQPFPSLKGYPIIIKVKPDRNSFQKIIKYRISIIG